MNGKWCESHMMAPAVCISNPLYGIHTIVTGALILLKGCHGGVLSWVGYVYAGLDPIGRALLYAYARPITRTPGRTRKRMFPSILGVIVEAQLLQAHSAAGPSMVLAEAVASLASTHATFGSGQMQAVL